MKLVTYWKNPAGLSTPGHITTFISIMQRKPGDSFLLLTPDNVDNYIGDAHRGKQWRLRNCAIPKKLIVVKCDYIRIAYIYEHGGFWLDADNLLVGDPFLILELLANTEGILWGSEGYFGSCHPRIQCFSTACRNMLEAYEQTWGNRHVTCSGRKKNGTICGIMPKKNCCETT